MLEDINRIFQANVTAFMSRTHSEESELKCQSKITQSNDICVSRISRRTMNDSSGIHQPFSWRRARSRHKRHKPINTRLNTTLGQHFSHGSSSLRCQGRVDSPRSVRASRGTGWELGHRPLYDTMESWRMILLDRLASLLSIQDSAFEAPRYQEALTKGASGYYHEVG